MATVLRGPTYVLGEASILLVEDNVAFYQRTKRVAPTPALSTGEACCTLSGVRDVHSSSMAKGDHGPYCVPEMVSSLDGSRFRILFGLVHILWWGQDNQVISKHYIRKIGSWDKCHLADLLILVGTHVTFWPKKKSTCYLKFCLFFTKIISFIEFFLIFNVRKKLYFILVKSISQFNGSKREQRRKEKLLHRTKHYLLGLTIQFACKLQRKRYSFWENVCRMRNQSILYMDNGRCTETNANAM